jgi:hypothetical protein
MSIRFRKNKILCITKLLFCFCENCTKVISREINDGKRRNSFITKDFEKGQGRHPTTTAAGRGINFLPGGRCVRRRCAGHGEKSSRRAWAPLPGLVPKWGEQFFKKSKNPLCKRRDLY